MLVFVFFALLVHISHAQRPPVTRFANVESIFVDRASFQITYTSCGRQVGGMFVACANAQKKREEFLDSLERWLAKFGVKVASDPASSSAVLKGKIHMDDNVEQRRRDYKSGTGSDQVPADWRDEDWTIDAWLENEFGDELWKNGQRDFPKPSHGWSGIGKIKGKELAKEIEHNLKKAR